MSLYKIQLKKEIPIPEYLAKQGNKQEQDSFNLSLENIIEQSVHISTNFMLKFLKDKSENAQCLTCNGSLLFEDGEKQKCFSVYELIIDTKKVTDFSNLV